MGLEFKDNAKKFDVYFKDLGKNNAYAYHNLSKTGSNFMEINLPANIPDFSQAELQATLGHELFHELQYHYRISFQT